MIRWMHLPRALGPARETGYETKRQIDVSIRWTFGVDKYLTIVQAKDHGRRADIKVVDEFLSVIRDVKATGGILICRSGFTKNAHTYARNCGVSLVNVHDTGIDNSSPYVRQACRGSRESG